LQDFNPTNPIRDSLRKIWINLFEFIKKYPDEFYFTEQFANSPYIDKVDTAKIDQLLKPIFDIIQYGINQKIIKDVSFELISAFGFYPIYTLSNPKICSNFCKSEAEIEKAFLMAWDAIKL